MFSDLSPFVKRRSADSEVLSQLAYEAVAPEFDGRLTKNASSEPDSPETTMSCCLTLNPTKRDVSEYQGEITNYINTNLLFSLQLCIAFRELIPV